MGWRFTLGEQPPGMQMKTMQLDAPSGMANHPILEAAPVRRLHQSDQPLKSPLEFCCGSLARRGRGQEILILDHGSALIYIWLASTKQSDQRCRRCRRGCDRAWVPERVHGRGQQAQARLFSGPDEDAIVASPRSGSRPRRREVLPPRTVSQRRRVCRARRAPARWRPEVAAPCGTGSTAAATGRSTARYNHRHCPSIRGSASPGGHHGEVAMSRGGRSRQAGPVNGK
jgi:hypothetical protein